MSDTNLPTPVQTFEVHIPENVRSGVYANTLKVNITGSEITLDFIYLNVNDTPQGTLTSRVILNRQSADTIVEALREIIKTANEVNPQ